MMAPAVHASTVTSGCAGATDATEANGFFTLSGSSTGANGCYVILFGDHTVTPSNTCSTACAAGGLTCPWSPSRGTQADCVLAFNWYLSSAAKAPAVPSSPAVTTGYFCSMDNANSGTWKRIHEAMGMPINEALGCNSGVDIGNTDGVAVCKCNDPALPTGPTVSGTSAVQTPGWVTVTGNVDEAATVYCNVAASGASHTASNVKAAGFNDDVGAAGSFNIAVTGVSGDGTKSVACVGEDASSNLGPLSVGAEFHFGTLCVARAMLSAPRYVQLTRPRGMYHQMPSPPP